MSDDAAETVEVVPIQEALRRVMRDVGTIGKDQQMKQGGDYSYRSIEDVMPKTSPLLVKHGVIPTPRVLSSQMTHHFNGKEYHHLYEVEWTFTGPAGDSLVASTIGEALDTRDKGANKAMTAALKQALTVVFQIAVRGAFDDPDHHGVPKEPSARSNHPKVKKALVDAATDAGYPDPKAAAKVVWESTFPDGVVPPASVPKALVAEMVAKITDSAPAAVLPSDDPGVVSPADVPESCSDGESGADPGASVPCPDCGSDAGHEFGCSAYPYTEASEARTDCDECGQAVDDHVPGCPQEPFGAVPA